MKTFGRVSLTLVVALAMTGTTFVVAQQVSQELKTQVSESRSGQATSSATASAQARGSAQARSGSLQVSPALPQRPLFAVWYTVKDQRPGAVRDVLANHDMFIGELYRRNLVFLEGPFTDQSGGLLILLADDLRSAEQVVASEPGVASGALIPTVKQWQVRTGQSSQKPIEIGKG